MIDRSAIFNALFTKLQNNVPGCVTYTRILQHWGAVQPNAMPYLGMIQEDQIVEKIQKIPSKWKLFASIYIYTYQPDSQTSPIIQMNTIVNAVEATLAPGPGPNMIQNLGIAGVQDCWISGRIQTDEGTIGPIAVSIIPIEIFAA